MDCEGGSSTTSSMEKKHEKLAPQLQFPLGFRFVATEAELIDVYLRCKIEGRDPPLDVVREVDLLAKQPGRLVEDHKEYGENKWYFFAKRALSSSNKEKEPSRKLKVEGLTATWKATGSVATIKRKGKVVGTKRVLIYHSSDAEEDDNWSMHEYVLAGHSQMGQYALYSIQRKQNSGTEHAGGSSKRRREAVNVEPGRTKKKQKKAASGKQHVLPEPPLTPAHEDRQMTPQQQQQQLIAGYDGNQQLGRVSVPMMLGYCSYGQQSTSNMATQFNFKAPSLVRSQPLSPGTNFDDNAGQYQFYHYVPENYLSDHYTMENNSNLDQQLGQYQLHRQQRGNEGAATGVQDEPPQGHGGGAVSGQQGAEDNDGSIQDMISMSFEGGDAAAASNTFDDVSGASFSDDDGFFSELDQILFGVDDPKRKAVDHGLHDMFTKSSEGGGDAVASNIWDDVISGASISADGFLNGPADEFLSSVDDPRHRGKVGGRGVEDRSNNPGLQGQYIHDDEGCGRSELVGVPSLSSAAENGGVVAG